VSSILNALRKVESESVPVDNAQPSLRRKIDPRKVIRSRYRESRLAKKLLLLVIPLVALAATLWVASQYGPFAISKASNAPADLSEPEKQEATLKEGFPEDPGKHRPSDLPQPGYARERNLPSKSAAGKGTPNPSPAKTPLIRDDGPSIEDPELKLQAIVWSESPENCFAVINGVIVRVGGKVEGVSVTEIGTNYVSFKSGQRTWKVKMMTE
jgi:hypothetical protein